MSEISKKPLKKILIVEDDQISRDVMDRQLRKYFQIDLAKDGNEAIELFSQNAYYLIMTDINLGIGKNGIEVMKEIRQTEAGKTIPVIAITAYANFGDRESFISAGFDNYISKPYRVDDLLRCIIDSTNNYQ
ncbi:MAG TPA: two-component system response regulator [Ignavibacteriales bacterium]|nr:two-component system response regulator [Ignavibacteriales bacterium]